MAVERGGAQDQLRIPVLCYGLRTDFRGELFEGSRYLLAWADEMQEIKTICHSGKKATMTVRVDESGFAVQDGPQVEIGGNDRYVSVSRKLSSRKITRGEGRIGANACAAAAVVLGRYGTCRGAFHLSYEICIPPACAG